MPLGLAPGPHRVRIEADVDRDGRIDPARGELVVTDLFYRETATLSEGWSLILGVFVFVAAFFLTVAFRRRKAMGSGQANSRPDMRDGCSAFAAEE